MIGHGKILDKLLPVFGRIYYGCGKWYKSEKFSHSALFNYVCKEFPPMFLTDGNGLSFEAQNVRLGKSLRALGVPVTEIYFDKTAGQVEHEYLFRLSDKTARDALEKVTEFIAMQTENKA